MLPSPTLNTNYRPQLLLAVALAAWLYGFLVLVGPFDAAEIPMRLRARMMPGYAIALFASYAVLIPIQNWLFRYLGTWKLSCEVAMICLFCLVALPPTFLYYRTEIVNGTFSFAQFLATTYLPVIAIMLPAIVGGRYWIARPKRVGEGAPPPVKEVLLLGDNKLDVLKLPITQLVALEAANNYVAVHYLRDGTLQKKLLRSSLRKLHAAVPDLIQVHRSYLVNMDHFVEWRGNLTLALTQLTVPVSQKYKAALLEASKLGPS